MEALWPECDPHAANNNLKATVHALRQTINPIDREAKGKESPSYVLFIEGNYIINPQAELWVDANEFEHHWVEGRRLDKDGKADEATKEYKLAEELYKGDYLEEDPYEEWTLVRREALKDIYLTILSKLSERSIAEGNFEDCIDYCHKILAKDPCREDAYRRIMQCHIKLGQRSSAVSWYKLCLKTLSTELDTVPEFQTTSMYNRLLKGESI
jgi:DNA-binding SARP family transcriptional activator